MMRKLSDLKISPAPWRVVTVNGRLHSVEASPRFVGDLMSVATVCSLHNGRNADARFIVAAPKLYKWLAFAVEQYKCETRSCDNCPNGKCWIVDAAAALAEAAGESEASNE